MDNCTIHHHEEVRAIVEGECGTSDQSKFCQSVFTDCIIGAKLIYLPPYLPDYNLIEQAFHSIKAWLHRHESDAVQPEVHLCLIQQASLLITVEDAEGWILNSGYSFIM